MLSAKQVEDYGDNGFLVLDSGLTDFQIEEIKSEILSSLVEIELRKADDPAYQDISRYRRFTVGLHTNNTPLALRKGQVVVLHPLVIHGSCENKTDGDRIALLSLYRKPRSDMSDAEKTLGIEVLRD
jgi:hypothetical protein